MDTKTVERLKKAQATYVAKRDEACMNGMGGASRISEKKLAGGFRISYNGRVWKDDVLVVEADGTLAVAS